MGYFNGQVSGVLSSFTHVNAGRAIRASAINIFPKRSSIRHVHSLEIINTYRTAVSPTLDLLCHEDFNVGRSEIPELKFLDTRALIL